MRGIDELPKCAGIYAIDTPDGSYVGQSRNLHIRAAQHWPELHRGTHHNHHLQRIFREKKDMSVKVLERAPSRLSDEHLTIWLDRREAFWMQRHRSALNIERSKAIPYDHDKHALEQRECEKVLRRVRGELENAKRTLKQLELKHQEERRRVQPLNDELNNKYQRSEKQRIGFAKFFLYCSLPGAIILGGKVLDTGGWSTTFLFSSLGIAAYLGFTESVDQKTTSSELSSINSKKDHWNPMSITQKKKLSVLTPIWSYIMILYANLKMKRIFFANIDRNKYWAASRFLKVGSTPRPTRVP